VYTSTCSLKNTKTASITLNSKGRNYNVEY